MNRMTISQKSAMHRAGKRAPLWTIERVSTATALISAGYASQATNLPTLTKGMAIFLTDQGRAWLENNC